MFVVAPLMNDGQKVETIQMSSVYEWIYIIGGISIKGIQFSIKKE